VSLHPISRLWRGAGCDSPLWSRRCVREGEQMPRLEVEGVGAFDVEEGKRLVLAIEEGCQLLCSED
jgi:hypothetical protein